VKRMVSPEGLQSISSKPGIFNCPARAKA